MASRMISIIGKQTFSMQFNTGGPGLIILGARFFAVQDAVSGVLLVRVTSTSGMPAGSSFSVSMVNTLVLPDDPGTLFLLASGGTIAGVSIAATDSGFPRLYVAGFTSAANPPCGPSVGMGLGAMYGTAAGLGTITMAVDLLVRDA